MNEFDFTALIDLYHDMDTQWDTVASAYEFQCNGCTDNCCTSLFYHHTHIEQAYLRYGFNQLPQPEQNRIRSLAQTYCDQTFANGNLEESLKLLCPANKDEKCSLYPYRPMICRLHGLPHELNRPGTLPVKGPGCDAGRFDQQHYIAFDRTPFYKRMAQLELTYRQAFGMAGKTKLTVAQILLL